METATTVGTRANICTGKFKVNKNRPIPPTSVITLIIYKSTIMANLPNQPGEPIFPRTTQDIFMNQLLGIPSFNVSATFTKHTVLCYRVCNVTVM